MTGKDMWSAKRWGRELGYAIASFTGLLIFGLQAYKITIDSCGWEAIGDGLMMTGGLFMAFIFGWEELTEDND